MERPLAGILAGHFTRVGTTDAIGDDVEIAVAQTIVGRVRLVDNDEVFIVTPHQAGIRAPRGRKWDGRFHLRHYSGNAMGRQALLPDDCMTKS